MIGVIGRSLAQILQMKVAPRGETRFADAEVFRPDRKELRPVQVAVRASSFHEHSLGLTRDDRTIQTTHGVMVPYPLEYELPNEVFAGKLRHPDQ